MLSDDPGTQITQTRVTHVTVSFSGKIPTGPYANVDVQVTWGADVGGEDTPEAVTRDLYRRIRAQVVEAVTPIAQARLGTIDHLLSSLPKDTREAILGQIGVIRWLQAVVPEMAFADSGASGNGNGGESHADQGPDGR